LRWSPRCHGTTKEGEGIFSYWRCIFIPHSSWACRVVRKFILFSSSSSFYLQNGRWNIVQCMKILYPHHKKLFSSFTLRVHQDYTSSRRWRSIAFTLQSKQVSRHTNQIFAACEPVLASGIWFFSLNRLWKLGFRCRYVRIVFLLTYSCSSDLNRGALMTLLAVEQSELGFI